MSKGANSCPVIGHECDAKCDVGCEWVATMAVSRATDAVNVLKAIVWN